MVGLSYRPSKLKGEMDETLTEAEKALFPWVLLALDTSMAILQGTSNQDFWETPRIIL